MASYPTSTWSPTTKNNGDVIQPAHINDAQSEIVAIESQLLTSTAWSPTIVSSGGGTATYTVQTGWYFVDGNAVTITGNITINSKAGLSAGNVSIGNLPVTPLAGVNFSATIGIFASLATPVVGLYGICNTGTGQIALTYLAAAGVSTSNLTVADIANGTRIDFSMRYLKA